MDDDQVDNYVPQCSIVLWSELDIILKDNYLSVLTLKARTITGKFADLITNINIIRKRFTFVIITGSWRTEDSNFVLEVNWYKSHILSKVRRTGGDIFFFI